MTEEMKGIVMIPRMMPAVSIPIPIGGPFDGHCGAWAGLWRKPDHLRRA
ncbi:MAG: hypothetical protein ABIY39_10075 [Sphingomonas sp.]